jgi:hypothetical protein
MRMQLFGRQQKNPTAASLKVQPDEREVPERSPHRRFRVTDLDDKKAARAQISTCFPQNDPHRIQAGISGGKRNLRLVPVLWRQRSHLARADVGRVRHDDIVGAAAYV